MVKKELMGNNTCALAMILLAFFLTRYEIIILSD